MKKLPLFVPLAILLGACTRTVSPPVTPPAVPAEVGTPLPAAAALPQDGMTFVPSRGRVLARGDGVPADTAWVSLGTDGLTLREKVRRALLLSDTPLLDESGNARGTSLPRGSRAVVREIGPWQEGPGGYRRLYRLEEGWVEAGSAALILAEGFGIEAGVVQRKIAISGGSSEYALLAIADESRVILVDTSSFIFPDAFHPSALLEIEIEDANADGLPEIVLEGETIVSFQYLGATPLRWGAWLRPKDGIWAPILFYKKHFAADEGYSYDAALRSFASAGAGFHDTVKVSTDYTAGVPGGEFRTTVVSFHRWNGSEYRSRPAEDLPRQGTVTADGTPLLEDPDPDAAIVEEMRAGDLLWVFDRSDAPREKDSWWYRACAKSGAEGWVNGSALELAWVDPLKVNRAAFLEN
jgi:hypothetical protein